MGKSIALIWLWWRNIDPFFVQYCRRFFFLHFFFVPLALRWQQNKWFSSVNVMANGGAYCVKSEHTILRCWLWSTTGGTKWKEKSAIVSVYRWISNDITAINDVTANFLIIIHNYLFKIFELKKWRLSGVYSPLTAVCVCACVCERDTIEHMLRATGSMSTHYYINYMAEFLWCCILLTTCCSY